MRLLAPADPVDQGKFAEMMRVHHAVALFGIVRRAGLEDHGAGRRPIRNALTACSVASSNSSPARALAWSRPIGPGQIEKYASMPSSRTASAPGPIVPARAMVGHPSARASRLTPTAVLPK